MCRLILFASSVAFQISLNVMNQGQCPAFFAARRKSRNGRKMEGKKDDAMQTLRMIYLYLRLMWWYLSRITHYPPVCIVVEVTPGCGTDNTMLWVLSKTEWRRSVLVLPRAVAFSGSHSLASRHLALLPNVVDCWLSNTIEEYFEIEMHVRMSFWQSNM